MPNVVIPAGGGAVLQPGTVGEYVNPAQPNAGIIYAAAGDRWDILAFRMYGDASQISQLILNNPGIPIEDTVDAGYEVFVPLIAPVASPVSSTPWA